MEILDLVLDGATLCLVLWFWQNRGRVATKLMDEPHPDEHGDRYQVLGRDDGFEYYGGYDGVEAQRIRAMDHGQQVALHKNGEFRG